MADTSITREERYLEYLTGDRKGNVPKPITRRERYLYELCLKGMGGEISPEEIKNAVNEYLEKNPVKPGATAEQAAQIEQNKKDVASLKEDISNKITKFYASSQGKTHLADSDNGKIMDMMLYGRSEQKQYSGKNLLNYDAWKGVSITRGTAVFEKNSFTLTATEDDCYTEPTIEAGFPDDAKIEISEGETVTLSWESSADISGTIYIYPNGVVDGLVYIDNHNAKTLTYTATRGVKFITFRFGVAYAGNTISYKNIQIEKKTKATSYEPYTGGIPSPNPDYPQEIKSVVNPTVKVCGKNLFDKNNCYDDKWIGDVQGNLETNNDFFTTNHIFVKKGATVAIKKCGTKRRGYFNISKTKFTYIENDNTTFTASEDCWLMVSCGKRTTPIEDFQIELGSTLTAYEPYHEQTVTLPYTLNAIPVSSGGNVVIDGQQYIADYVDVERGKLVKTVDSSKLDNTQSIVNKTEWLLAESQETDLTTGEIAAFKALVTYYPTTNISVNSEQLDGYTVFNYPIPFEDEWIKTKKDVDSLKARLNDIVGYDNAAAHNAIYRGKNLGTQFTAEMSANIKNGTFKDLYCGDYLIINGTTYRFMDLDYLYKTGDTSLEVHHILVVPDAPMYNHVMNDTDTTSGGYVGSKMYTSGLDQALAKIKADFGEAHIVTYRNLLVNAVSNDIPSSWAWYSRQIDLMNEEMVYGTRAWSQASQNGYDTGTNKSQLAAFQHNHSLISSCRSRYWLRAVQSSAYFCGVGSGGVADRGSASGADGVRPCFLIS